MKEYDYLPLELRKMGLTKNEAEIYLILLESGTISIGKIGEKTGLSRPTVYRVLESLEKKELIGKIEKGKKNHFIAGSPDNFLKILKVRKRKAEEQEREFLRIISILQGKYHVLSNRNEIKIFKGKQNHKILLEDLSNSSTKRIKILFSEENNISREEIMEVYNKIKTRMGALEVKEIHSKISDENLPNFISRKITKNTILQNLIIAENKIYIFEKEDGYVIEQETAIEAYRNFFDLLWENLK